jgi:hypothetical protein
MDRAAFRFGFLGGRGWKEFPVKSFVAVVVLVLASAITWQIADKLSADALGLAIGVLFGIVAGVPVALLVLVSTRRGERRVSEDLGGKRFGSRYPSQYEGQGHGYVPQPPVIVLAGHGMPGQVPPHQYAQDPQAGAGRHALPAPPETVDVRQFKVVGEKEEWVDEW